MARHGGTGSRRRSRVTRIARALVIGVATLFAPKREHEQHWSTPPTMIVDRKDVVDEDRQRLPETA